MPKAKTDEAPPRLPTLTVPSDDCELVVDGEKYYPHRGEWVTVVRGPRSISELKLIWGFNAFQVELDGLKDDQEKARREMLALVEQALPGTVEELTDAERKEQTRLQAEIDKQIEALALIGQMRYDRLSQRYDQFAGEVAEHLVDWNWTNRVGRPLPQPDGTIGPLQGLAPDEIYYLRQVISGEAPAERKNGSPA